jgi:hypothetical protein
MVKDDIQSSNVSMQGNLEKLGCRTGPPAYVALRAGTATLCHKLTLSLQSGTMNSATKTLNSH